MIQITLSFFIITDEGNNVIALSLLVYLLPDSRSKPDADKVVFFTHVSVHMVFDK